MEDIIFICAHPDDNYFVWQTEVLINNFRKYGLSDKMHVLLYKPIDRPWNPEFDIIIDRYKEVNFFKYEDKGAAVSVYLPVLRPHILKQHFKALPELSSRTIFYHDCDILFTERPDIEKLIAGDTWYVSNTASYIPYEYFNSKIKDVKEIKKDQWDTDKILTPILENIGTTVEDFKKLGNNAGGAQYILKNIDWKFWEKCENDCLNIYLYFRSVNASYFPNEDKGIQRWCADMWAIIWNGLRLKRDIQVVPELDFCWATDEIKDKKVIYHNAGATGNEPTLFFKGAYIAKLPWEDDLSYVDKNKCSSLYAKEILEVKDKYYTMDLV